MFLKEISFRGYRNLEDNKIFPHENVNVIYGENAQGKTNLLESVWLYTGGHSFRGSKDSELINFGKDFACSECVLNCLRGDIDIKILINKKKRLAKINDVDKGFAARIVGEFKAVVFSPVHLSLVKDGPESRRKLIDTVLCQLKPTYAKILSRYNHTLKQRNALLKDLQYNKSNSIDTLLIWNNKLVEYGAIINKERINLLEILNFKAKEIYKGISSEKEKFNMEYKSSIGFNKDMDINFINKMFTDCLNKNQNIDLKYGTTSVGPHRDDIDILLDDKLAKNFGSQGQQRSCVLAIKMAEAGVMEEISGEKPVILLDDVMSELDASRQNYMMNKMGDWQVFITCCELSVVDRLKVGKVFKVCGGNVREE